MQNVLMEELMALARIEEANRVDQHRVEALKAEEATHIGIRASLASALLRAAYALDANAGSGRVAHVR